MPLVVGQIRVELHADADGGPIAGRVRYVLVPDETDYKGKALGWPGVAPEPSRDEGDAADACNKAVGAAIADLAADRVTWSKFLARLRTAIALRHGL